MTPTNEAPIEPPQPAQSQSGLSTLTRTQREVGGREGPDPTRYGDWELRGRCIDF